MIRRPLRPLARILKARALGQNTDLIEAEERARRLRAQRIAERQSAEHRLLFVAAAFLAGFVVIGLRMALIAAQEPEEPRAFDAGASIITQRSDIVDRNGSILATNLVTASLYAQPQQMVDKRAAAEGLARIFPDLDADALFQDFTGARKFLWIRRKLSPEQQQAVHDLGEPGLMFGPRELRLYPNGSLAAHILGGTGFGREGVHAAEIIGTAGVERQFDAFLRDPALNGEPLRLSIDLSVQAAMEDVLAGGMVVMNAKGAGAVLMEVGTGQIIAMASLPDFDPNHRPALPVSGDKGDSPLFNRMVQGLYELGSTFKPFAAALALDRGIAGPDTMIDTAGPMKWGKFTIRDFHDYGARLSLTDVIVKSSNIGAAHLALAAGGAAQQDFLKALGFFAPVPVELPEAAGTKPLLPQRWSELSTITISYGHGMSISPLHLAAGYAAIANGGIAVVPTLLANSPVPGENQRVMSEATAFEVRSMLRQVVTRGTASMGDVEGYEVAGKTGTADKPRPNGGYFEDKVITTFASMFPVSDPKYVLVVTLDEPVEDSGTEDRRTAGWTAVPVGAEIIRRIAPLMNVWPSPGIGTRPDGSLLLVRSDDQE
jgi:cell division protein FtsI (penicillin-binding protein 3)